MSAFIRFMAKVDRHDADCSCCAGCWIWTAARLPKGYGRFYGPDGTVVYAHRFSYELAFGAIPDGAFVLHRCDTPQCVNPSHLRAGTAADNNRDAAEKGRSALGERNAAAKLVAHQVAEIRALAATRALSQTAIARRFGVGQTAVSKIHRRIRWAHV